MATPPDFSVGQVLTSATMNQVGLWLTASGTATAQTNVDVVSCFTDDFENYQVIISGLSVSAVPRQIRFRFLSGTTPNTDANFLYGFTGLNNAGTAANSNGTNTDHVLLSFIDTFSNTKLANARLEILQPKISGRTQALGQSQGFATPNNFWRSGGFEQYGTNSFDGFRLFLDSTGTITCNYAVYGYNL
jgi:hypothetical protein